MAEIDRGLAFIESFCYCDWLGKTWISCGVEFEMPQRELKVKWGQLSGGWWYSVVLCYYFLSIADSEMEGKRDEMALFKKNENGSKWTVRWVLGSVFESWKLPKWRSIGLPCASTRPACWTLLWANSIGFLLSGLFPCLFPYLFLFPNDALLIPFYR